MEKDAARVEEAYWITASQCLVPLADDFVSEVGLGGV